MAFVALTRSFSSGVWEKIRKSVHPQRGRSGKPAGGHVRKLAYKQTGEMREQTEWHRVVLFGSSRKWQVNICARARRSTSKVASHP